MYKLKSSVIVATLLYSVNASTILSANEEIVLDSMSVTATKIKTATKDVSQSIAVVDEKTIEDKNILNIQQAIENIPGVIAESSSNSPSPKIIIRGAGLKARYGVREIMVIKDGVPMTDPDSFTRFDYIDMQDVSSIEVQKGPGSINAANATGGVIQLITKSVFDDTTNRIKIGAGNDGQQNFNLKLTGELSESDFTSMTFSSRKIDNSWRDNNDFDSTQLSIKYGHVFEDESTIETEVAYTKSNMNLPASMDENEFAEFLATGEQHDTTSSPWQNSARDSEIYSLNTKYEKEFENFTFKPRVYFNTWDHFHPVTGFINDSKDNDVFGTDLELNNSHELFGNEAIFVGGLTLKMDKTNDAKKYTYADLNTTTVTPTFGAPYETIVSTLSNEIGDLASVEDTKTTLYGIYAIETFKPTSNLSVDLSARFDRLNFDLEETTYIEFDYAKNNYSTLVTPSNSLIDKSYNLFSSKMGLNYQLTNETNFYTSIAQANQAPTTSELGDNSDLNKTKSINYEIGFKTRTKNISYDLAIYQNDVKDEIVQIKESTFSTTYDNAGETQKRGLEFNFAYNFTNNFQFGGAYAYSDFKYKSFYETVRVNGAITEENRDGNYLPYIPKNQYSLFVAINLDNGFKSRITTKSYGSYYMDNANTEKYEGYDLITDLMLGFERKNHNIQFNINNVFDKYYAMDASKDTDGDYTYKAASPRSYMLTYAYKF